MNTPTINVNLKPCDCPPSDIELQMHETSCASAPVRIPCPLQPSVTFKVALGECFCNTGDLRDMPLDGGGDLHICPARPISIACAIGSNDGSWASSFVADAYVEEGPGRVRSTTPEELEAARNLWTLVKALVTGHADLSALLTGPKAVEFLTQRDAVYAALCEKVRAEQADDATTRDLIRLVPGLKALDVDAATARDYLSARALTAYVKRLIEQVGNLEGGK